MHAINFKHLFEVNGTSAQIPPTSKDSKSYTFIAYTLIISEYKEAYHYLGLLANVLRPLWLVAALNPKSCCKT